MDEKELGQEILAPKKKMAVEMGGLVKNTRSRDKNNNRRRPRRTPLSTTETKDSYLREIEKLDDEVRRLESEIDQQEAVAVYELSNDGTIEKVLLDLKESDHTSTSARINSTNESKEEALVSTTSSLETFTGIRFELNQCTAISKSTSKTIWRRRLTGSCQKIPFVVEFEVDEKEIEEGTSDDGNQESVAVITRLSVELKDSLATQELLSYIKTIQEDKALQPFLQTLVQYGECNHNRQKTFFHFKTKFPDVVHLLGGSSQSTAMQMINPVQPGLIFTVQWKLDITSSGRVVPDIEIHASAPSNKGKKTRNSLLKTAPRQFRRMMSELGIEHSIEMILSVVLRL